MTGSPPKHAPFLPGWISKPLRAMVPDELVDLRAALCLESPPDGVLLRAIDGQLARYAAASPDLDEESEDWAWAADG